MAPPDPEKRVNSSAEDEGHGIPRPSAAKRVERRVLCWLLTFVAVLLLFGIRWCSAATLPPSTRHKAKFQRDVLGGRSPSLNVPESATTTSSAAAPTRTVIKTFEVDQPVLLPGGPAESDGSTRPGDGYSPELCTVLLMRHDFAWSYGAPFVGKPNPWLPCLVA